jgi:hypothetical protein
MVKRKIKYTFEFFLATLVASMLILSLIFQSMANVIPQYTITLLITLFIIIKVIHIFRQGGTIFEDYASLFLLVIVAILRFLTVESKINTPLVVVGIIATLYSVGIIPSIRRLSRSKNVISFIVSYIILIVAIIFLFAGTYIVNDDSFRNEKSQIELTFRDSLYFSTMTFTTVGYGDISPIGINRLIASIESLLGIILNIGFIGYILASKRFRD